jgi:hypothetical protein
VGFVDGKDQRSLSIGDPQPVRDDVADQLRPGQKLAERARLEIALVVFGIARSSLVLTRGVLNIRVGTSTPAAVSALIDGPMIKQSNAAPRDLPDLRAGVAVNPTRSADG